MPDFYTEKVNLFVALAPVASTHNIEVPSLQKSAKYWRLIQFAAERLGVYNIFGVNWWEDEAMLVFCGLFEGLCEEILSAVADANPEVDNMDRLGAFLSNFPAGSSFQDLCMFAQNVVHDDFRQFNYGEIDNLSIYNRVEPPRVPLGKFNLPVALFQGDTDRLADELDVEWLSTQISGSIVFRQLYSLGHMSFTLAKDMTWFKVDAVNLVNQYATNSY